MEKLMDLLALTESLSYGIIAVSEKNVSMQL